MEGGISQNDPTVFECWCFDEDYETFSNINELREHLHEIDAFTEAYVFTGNEIDDVKPVKILKFIIEDVRTAKKNEKKPESTEYVNVKHYELEKNKVVTLYYFSKKLLENVKFI